MSTDHIYSPGDVISIRFAGVLRHYGVVGLDGRVISNSRAGGGVITQSLADFADGRPVMKHRRFSQTDPLEIDARARRHIGKDYDWAGSNCVHLVRGAHKRKPTTLQVTRAVATTVRDMLRGL